MTTLRTAAQQALEALEAGLDVNPIFAGEAEEALRAALAQQDELQPMPYNPRPPLGCDQQGRYPQAAEPCVDLDELGVRLPEPDPWWHDWLLVAVALLVLGLVFAPLGV